MAPQYEDWMESLKRQVVLMTMDRALILPLLRP